MTTPNQLYYGDNLEVLRRYIADESVDLVYLDPPFNSNANYNVLFAEKDGSRAASQIRAFSDTWTWNIESEETYADIVTAGGRVADCLRAFRTFLGECDMLAYLVMMAPRLVELRRVLKPTGSIYLHCDPTASHYLKMLMDGIFGAENFMSEIAWKRTSAHSSANRFGPVHDLLLYYGKTKFRKWNKIYTKYTEEYIDEFFDELDEKGRRYKRTDLTGSGIRNGETGKPWRGIDITAKGRHWAYSPSELDKLDKLGKIHWPKKKDGMPRLKQYPEDLPGVPLQDVWTDIRPIHNKSAERLGYPTQKPEELLLRIISASSDASDIVLDPFCGCGTSISASQRMGRTWIGIDITHLAITLIKTRLLDSYGSSVFPKIIGEPVSLPDAEKLAETDPYQFQWWALGLVGARPVEQKKGADKGIDGRIVFQGDKTGVFENVIISVKAGKLTASYLRDLIGVIAREKAAIGVLISMQEPTGPMKTEAAAAGFFESDVWGKRYPKVQLLTIEDLLNGKRIDMPPIRQVGATFKKAPKVAPVRGEQKELKV